MIPNTDRAFTVHARRHAGGIVAVALMLAGFGFTGCGAISAVRKVVHTIRGNKATIDTFTNKINSAKATPFEATYVTTGGSPATIVYAVQPPTGLAFSDTPSADNPSKSPTLDVIVNSTGEYLCSPPSGSGSSWSCQKLKKASAADENNIFDFYTPSHWVTFLRDFSLAAGFAGDKVTSSTLTVNGFVMSCVDFRASGVAGTSTICTTAQGILGYVKVAGNSTSFEIKDYSASPQSSLFQVPPGAKITTVTTPTTTS